MTLKEYQECHYKLWDYIADRILQSKKCLFISKLKSEWFRANYKHYLDNNCFICDYLLSSANSCKECATMLGFKRNGECLGGLYFNCLLSTSYIEQYKKACEIRDIWGGNPT